VKGEFMKLNFILILIGYLLGSIPFAFIVSKYMGKIDIRNHGSGNAGATNAFRVLGFKSGLLAFIGDFLKGFIAVYIGLKLSDLNGGLLTGLFAVIGHCYPITLGFKGGKGVATTAGIVVAINPLMALILMVIEFGIIFATRIVSLASISAAILFPILSYLFKMERNFIIISIILGAFVIYRHRSNIGRLLNGTESKFK